MVFTVLRKEPKRSLVTKEHNSSTLRCARLTLRDDSALIPQAVEEAREDAPLRGITARPGHGGGNGERSLGDLVPIPTMTG